MLQKWIRSLQKIVSFYGSTADGSPESPLCPDFTIPLRLTTDGRTSPDSDRPETENSDNEINSNMNKFIPYPANVENVVNF